MSGSVIQLVEYSTFNGKVDSLSGTTIRVGLEQNLAFSFYIAASRLSRDGSVSDDKVLIPVVETSGNA